MKGDDRRPEEGQLFDLPLEPSRPSAPEEPGRLPLFDAEPSSGRPPARHEADPEPEAPAGEPAATGSPLGARWLAGGIDLLVHAVVVAVLLAGSWLAGAGLEVADSLGFLVVLAIFSFLYTVIPLAFWGATPGMVRARLVARNRGDQPLTFGQTGLRWLGAVATVLTLGLASLLALRGGRSLGDRISGSETRRRPA